MSTQASTVRDLPDALRDRKQFAAKLADRRPAVFLDYDGVLTPIVDRPEDAVLSDGMRGAVQALAQRCSVCVVSGRDRPVVQPLIGVDNLVVAGSHGFDIWSPQEGTIAHDPATGFEGLMSEVTDRLRVEVESIPGAVVEPKREAYAANKQRMVVKLIRGRRVRGLPRRVAFRAGRARHGNPDGGVIIEERGTVPAPDPARLLRR